MSIDCRVPVDRTPTGYQVPGFLIVEILLIQEDLTVHSETDGLRSMLDKGTV